MIIIIEIFPRLSFRRRDTNDSHHRRARAYKLAYLLDREKKKTNETTNGSRAVIN